MSEPLDLLAGCVRCHLEAADAEQTLRELSGLVVVQGFGAPTLPDAVVARERAFPTGLPTAVPSAIPHTDPRHVLRPGFAVATLTPPVTFRQMGSPDETVDAELVVLLCVTDGAAQIDALQQVLARLRDEDACRSLVAHRDPTTFENAVREWLAAV